MYIISLTVLISSLSYVIYLKCDVLLLADVFEHFRKTSISYYKLDPAKYITIASYAWDAMLLNNRYSNSINIRQKLIIQS
jgi:hypothetical protein